MDFKLKQKLHSRPKKSAVAIYIGPESVEIVHMKRTPTGISIAKHVSKEILKKDLTSNVIKEIFLTEGIKETSVTTTIPEESIMLRRFTMPIIPPQDRPTAIRFEAKRHIPFNIDEVISNFHVIKEDRTKNQMEILFAAVKKEEIKSLLSLLDGAGLAVERVEPVSLALIKTLLLTGNLEETSPPTAILHFSTKTEAQIIIAENGIPYLKREISLVSKDTKIEEQLLNEIRLSLSYYKREFPEKNLAKIIICGLKDKPAWLSLIKEELNITTEYDLPFKNISDIDLPSLQFEIPIGLASMRLERPRIELNLLPEEAIPVRLDTKKWIAIEITAIVCILGLIYLLQLPAILGLKRDAASSEKKKTTYPGLTDLSGKTIDELNQIKTALLDKKNILNTCTTNRIIWHEKLQRLVQIMPKETWITELSTGDSIGTLGQRQLILKGSTYTTEPAKEIEITNNFSKNLKDDSGFMNGFSRLTLGTINKATVEGHQIVNFDISVTTD